MRRSVIGPLGLGSIVWIATVRELYGYTTTGTPYTRAAVAKVPAPRLPASRLYYERIDAVTASMRFVRVDTEDGPITVRRCLTCGTLDPSPDNFHDPNFPSDCPGDGHDADAEIAAGFEAIRRLTT